MRLLGAEVRSVDSGSRTLKDAINEAMRDWVTNVRSTHYLLGSVLGAHPYPTMVRDFHKVIGREARAQILKAEGKLPTAIVACVGGGSNSIGIFHEFIKDKKVKLIGVEAGGRGEQLGDHAARFRGGSPGVLQGTYSYVLQDAAGQIATTHSVSAGLDYPSIGPEHAWLKETGRAEYVPASDAEALEACTLLARTEGIIPALESAHAVAEVVKRAPKMKKSDVVIVNISFLILLPIDNWKLAIVRINQQSKSSVNNPRASLFPNSPLSGGLPHVRRSGSCDHAGSRARGD